MGGRESFLDSYGKLKHLWLDLVHHSFLVWRTIIKHTTEIFGELVEPILLGLMERTGSGPIINISLIIIGVGGYNSSSNAF